MNKQIKKLISFLFCVFLLAVTTAYAIFPADSFSENENRVLAQQPNMSAQSIMSGEYSKELEDYITDRFPFRDVFVSAKAHMEKFSGKKENNGVYFAADGYLIEKPETQELDGAIKNFGAINKMEKTGKYNVSLMLVPTAYEVLSEKLPDYAYTDIQRRASDAAAEAFSGTNVKFIDPTAELKKHKDEYIYFYTDHHQTAYGSYLTYRYLCGETGLAAYEESDFYKKNLSAGFFGTMWSNAPLADAKGDVVSIYEPKFEISYEVGYKLENKKSDSLYDMSWLDKKDKYSVFFGGNHPIVTIKTSNHNGKTLAVFKDSYANSLMPFLVNHYETLHMIDLRYYNANPIDYLDENGISDVLILYNTPNFLTDTNPVKLGAFIK